MNFPRRFSLKCPWIAPAEMCNTSHLYFGPLEDKRCEAASFKPKSRGENFSRRFLHSEFYGTGWAVKPPIHWMILCILVIVIQPGFIFGHPLLQEIVWIAPKKSKLCSDDWHTWRFWSAFSHFGTHFAESFCMSKSSWMMDPHLSRDMPVAQLLNYLKSGGLSRLVREFDL